MVHNNDLKKRKAAAFPKGIGRVTLRHTDEARNVELWDEQSQE